jgi:hypothetical protein
VGVEDALLEIVIVPFTAPVAVGANWTLNALTPLGSTEMGGERVPTIEKPVPDSETCKTLTGAFPGLLTVTVCCAAPPTWTAPNGMLLGLTTICACAATPVPVNLTIVGAFEALLVIAIVPLTGPTVVGANWTLTTLDFPGAMLIGRENAPVMLKAFDEITICEIDTLAVPGFFIVSTRCAAPLSTALPKAKVLVERDSAGPLMGVAPVAPTHPVCARHKSSVAARVATSSGYLFSRRTGRAGGGSMKLHRLSRAGRGIIRNKA